jgi:hypothetical protein
MQRHVFPLFDREFALSTAENGLKATLLGSTYGLYHGLSTAPGRTPILSSKCFVQYLKRPILRFSLLFGVIGLTYETTRHIISNLYYSKYNSLSNITAGAVSGAIFGYFAFEPASRSPSLTIKSAALFMACAAVLNSNSMRGDKYLQQSFLDSNDLDKRLEENGGYRDLSQEEVELLLDILIQDARKKRQKRMNSTMEHTAPNITDNGEDNATNQQMVANENNNNNN